MAKVTPVTPEAKKGWPVKNWPWWANLLLLILITGIIRLIIYAIVALQTPNPVFRPTL